MTAAWSTGTAPAHSAHRDARLSRTRKSFLESSRSTPRCRHSEPSHRRSGSGRGVSRSTGVATRLPPFTTGPAPFLSGPAPFLLRRPVSTDQPLSGQSSRTSSPRGIGLAMAQRPVIRDLGAEGVATHYLVGLIGDRGAVRDERGRGALALEAVPDERWDRDERVAELTGVQLDEVAARGRVLPVVVADELDHPDRHG